MYSIWIGDEITEKHSINITEFNPETKFYDVMVLAARKSNTFKFEYKNFSFGKYVTKINGKSEIPSKNIFWMLYIVPDMKTLPTNQHLSDLGVSDLTIQNGNHYIFWLKTFLFQ